MNHPENRSLFFVKQGPRLVSLLFLTALGSAISLFVLGFQFDISNNIFQIPYVLDLPSLPQFVDDAFYQTLRYFTSAVWPLIRLVSNEDNINSVFLVSHIISRALSFFMLTVLLVQLGVRQRISIAIGVVVLAVSPWFQHGSVVADHGMFTSYFAHTELTWPFIIAGLLGRATGKLKLSAAMAGITFSINAFVGAWLCIILGICYLSYKAREGIKIIAMEVAIFIVVAAPVAIWIQSSLAASDLVVTFSFIEYIRSYFPGHFLIEAASPEKLINLISMLAAGVFASIHVRHGRFWRIVLLACVGIFCVGAILPYLFDHRIVFNLHFLRVDGIIQLVCVSLIIAAALLNMQKSTTLRQNIVWVAILMFLAAMDIKYPFASIFILLIGERFLRKSSSAGIIKLPVYLQKFLRRDGLQLESAEFIFTLLVWILAGMAMLLWSRSSSFRMIYFPLGVLIYLAMYGLKRNGLVLMLTAIALVPALAINAIVGHYWTVQSIAAAKAGPDGQLAVMARWIRSHPLQGVILLSSDALGYSGFQLDSRNPVWVDQKQGAAVMWHPPFYAQWMHRYQEAKRLTDFADVEAYARRNAIPYIVFKSDLHVCPAGGRLLTESGPFRLCAIAY